MVREILGTPLVTICIPFRDHPEIIGSCVTSILEKTTYPRIEILAISNNSRETGTFELMEKLAAPDLRIRFTGYDGAFNYSGINNHAAGLARGEYLVLMNDDITLITPAWIEALLEHAQRKEVGAVGGKLYYPDGTLQHAGIVAGIAGFAGRPHRRCPGESTGYMHRLVLTRNVSAVTGALMMVKRSTYLEAGGMDAEHLPVSLNDVDFCLRLLELGTGTYTLPTARRSTRSPSPRTRGQQGEKRTFQEGDRVFYPAPREDPYRRRPVLQPESLTGYRRGPVFAREIHRVTVWLSFVQRVTLDPGPEGVRCLRGKNRIQNPGIPIFVPLCLECILPDISPRKILLSAVPVAS